MLGQRRDLPCCVTKGSPHQLSQNSQRSAVVGKGDSQIIVNLPITYVPRCSGSNAKTDWSRKMQRLHWSTKIFSHEEKCLFQMYFWMLNVSRISIITHIFRNVSDYVTAQAYICESLGTCRWYSVHVVTSRVTCHTRLTNGPLPDAGQSSLCYHPRRTVFIPPLIWQESV